MRSRKTWHRHIRPIMAATVATVAVATTIALAPDHRAGPAEYYPPAQVVGIANPDVRQDNIQDTICVSGYTKTIRPPTSYTNPLKLKEMEEYHLSGSPADYELDHYIALTDGGDPIHEANLWMQPRANAALKDRLEPLVNKKICSGEWTLKQGQECLTHDWYRCYQDIGLDIPSFGGIMLDPDDD